MNRKKKKQELTDIQGPRWIVIRFLGIMIPENVMINVKKHVFADNQNVDVLNNNRTQVSSIPTDCFVHPVVECLA